MIGNSHSFDPNYDLLKKEFNILSNNTKSIQTSLSSYCKNIKELYLSPNSICNNFKKYYDNQHPLSLYSENVLVFIESGISDWELNQNDNFKKIQNYLNQINNCNLKFDKIDKLLISNNNNDFNKNEYINLKSNLFKDVKELFNLKIENLDIPLINIQLSIQSLFELLNQILSNSSPLLQNHINFNNPILNLLPNNDFININKQQQQPQQTTVPPLRPAPPPLQKQQQNVPLRPAPPPQQPQQLPILKKLPPQQPQFSQFKRSEQNIQKTNKLFEKMSIKDAPPLDKLIYDHQLHKKLWDNKRFKLVKKYNYSVSTEYKIDIKYKPGCTLYKVLIWMTIPPESLNSQTIRKSTMKLYDGESNKELIQPEIIYSDHQSPIWYFQYVSPPAPFKFHYVAKEIIEVDLYKVELVEVDDPNEIIEVELITDLEIEIYLRPTDKMNYNTPEFKQFIIDNKFYPIQFQDGTMESVLCFAYRIYLWMVKNLTYKWPHELSGKPLETFNAKYGDCGCHTFFFASIMRYSNIPTRLLFGRGAKLDLPGDGQTHVKPEIYISEIGWVPIECTGKGTGYQLDCFGKDTGEFITYCMDYHSNVKDISHAFTSFQLCHFGNYIQRGPNPEMEHFKHLYNVSKLT